MFTFQADQSADDVSITELRQTLARQQTQIDQLLSSNQKLANELSEIKQKQQQQQQHVVQSNTADVTPEIQSLFSSFACTGGVVNITCPESRTIFVTSATYAKYDFQCTEGCCAPHPELDCWEPVDENRPEDWVAIKLFCDNMTNCQFENRGSIISECEVGYMSDYLQIFYDCLPEDLDAPVAFTAYSDLGFSTAYVTNQQVIFDKTLTNFGGHYNAQTSTFTCPYDGIYAFSISLLADFDNRLDLSINRNSELIGYAWAYSYPDSERYEAASAFITASCSRSDVIWVKAETDGSMFADQQLNTFTGFLLQKL